MDRYVTVEPVQLFYGIMSMVSDVVRDHLFIEKTCLVYLGKSASICSNLSAHEDIKNEVQEIVAKLEVLDGILVALPALLFSLFMGSWSDKHGRKLLLIVPFIGNILAFIFYILNTYFFYELGLYHLLWGSCVGLFGRYICLNIGLYGYIADVSSSSSRTTRLSLLNGVSSLSFVIGNLIGGQIFKATQNYYLIFGISIAFGVLGMSYAYFFVNESVGSSESTDENNISLYNSYHVRECFKTVIKDRRPAYPRFGIMILVLHFAMIMFSHNTSHYDYLFMVKKFDWRVSDYSNFLIVARLVRLLGLFVILPLFSSVLRFKDEIITLLGTLGTVASYFIIAFGESSWLMFFATLFQFNSIVTVSIRSQCTKAIDEGETGKVFAVIALGQSLVPLISNPLYGLLYRETLSVFPGAYLLIVAGLLLLSSAGAIYIYVHQRGSELPEVNLIDEEI